MGKMIGGIVGLTIALGIVQVPVALALSITQTTNTSALGTALGGSGLTINSVTINNGAPSQFGTYTGFTSAPITIGDGLVLSTGLVEETTSAFHSAADVPDTNLGGSGTSAFNNYGVGNIENFSDSNDVASLSVSFTLSAPSQVGFDFVFGSIEYPNFTSDFTDAFLAFLDGSSSANQIVFDAANNPVQVGMSFASALTTADTNTAFADPHGLLKLQTFTANQLSAGSHTLNFQIGDVNDHQLDSGVFISNFHAGAGTPGTTPVPEPATVLLLAASVAGLGFARHKISVPRN
ncbi:MAG: choice-of-anchor L domain-containing protein [Nitrospira sp.]